MSKENYVCQKRPLKGDFVCLVNVICEIECYVSYERLHKTSVQEWTNRTPISHERTSVHFLVLPGSHLSIAEITECTYSSLT